MFVCVKEDNVLLCFTLDVTFCLSRITVLFVVLHFQAITVKYIAAKDSDILNTTFSLLVSWVLS